MVMVMVMVMVMLQQQQLLLLMMMMMMTMTMTMTIVSVEQRPGWDEHLRKAAYQHITSYDAELETEPDLFCLRLKLLRIAFKGRLRGINRSRSCSIRDLHGNRGNFGKCGNDVAC